MLLVVGLSCSGEDLTGPPPEDVSFFVSLLDATGATDSVHVVVSAPDLSPRSFGAPVQAGAGRVVAAVPPGAGRALAVSALAAGLETHRGQVAIEIRGDTVVATSVSLAPTGSGDPLTASAANATIIVAGIPSLMTAGDTVTISARVEAVDGSARTAVVTWSSDDPAVATVETAGGDDALLTARGPGTTFVAASSGGLQGGAMLVVEPAATGSLSLQLVASGLTNPVFVTHAPGDGSRLFMIERGGRIKILRGGSVLPRAFLDIAGRVQEGGEQGLLSVAFHPDYAQNGEIFVYYTNLAGDSHLSRIRVSPDPDSANPATEEVLLVVNQPYANHNGGLVTFGPDGMLYIGLGDGGSGGDPLGNGQDSTTLLGSILRIDVDGGAPYAIPNDNPFVNDAAARKEIWAYGLRNPWRFSFDRATGDLYIGDVGQNAWEEIDVVPAGTGGVNLGWNVMEGLHCYNAATCNESGLTLPVVEYPHAGGCSVTGGYVYRGAAVPSLHGRYFYADYCQGWIRSFRYESGRATDVRDHTADIGTRSLISSFGEDADGEIYVVTLDGGIYLIRP
jgi:glucose/arabinose dehydrogenase